MQSSEMCGYSPPAAMDRRDYFAAHAPPLPKVIADAWEEHLKFDEPDAMRMPWNEFVLQQMAVQEARWRRVYADRLIQEMDRKVEREVEEASQ